MCLVLDYGSRDENYSSTSSKAQLVIPIDIRNKTIYIVVEVHDNGMPNLYGFRRLIVNIKE